MFGFFTWPHPGNMLQWWTWGDIQFGASLCNPFGWLERLGQLDYSHMWVM